MFIIQGQILRVLKHVHKLLLSETRISKRSLFYTSKDLFSSQRESDRTIVKLTKLLSVKRSELNIYASSRGFFAGDLTLTFSDFTKVSSSPTLFTPTLIRGDIEPTLLRTETQARCVLVIEKYSYFHRLASSESFRTAASTKCICVTACGYPNEATIFLLGKLGLPMFVLADYDPYGIDIVASYERAVPSVAVVWVGLSAADLHSLKVDSNNVQELSGNDVRKARAMMKRCPKYADEIRVMIDVSKKIELEAVANDPLFEKRLIDKMLIQ